MSKRKYRSSIRARQAAETRASILSAADGLFRRQGWESTTIAAIAGAASVSAETVYANFGNKRALISELVVTAVRRDATGVPVIEQESPRNVLEAPDQSAQIDLFAHDIADVLARVAPLMAVVRSAALAEPELESLYERLHEGRRENIARFVDALMKNGPLRSLLDRQSATATVWRLASPELYNLTTGVEGLDTRSYAEWLGDSLKYLLLVD